jgi:hypothetical protein
LPSALSSHAWQACPSQWGTLLPTEVSHATSESIQFVATLHTDEEMRLIYPLFYELEPNQLFKQFHSWISTLGWIWITSKVNQNLEPCQMGPRMLGLLDLILQISIDNKRC